MANPNRKLATLRTIDAVTPIEGADRIECAHLGGWPVVIGKGDFAPGDCVIYFEVDSFLPTDDARFAFLAPRGTKEMLRDDEEVTGHVLRTAKLRGQYSQGLVMPIDAFPEVVDAIERTQRNLEQLVEERFDLTDVIGIWEYEKPIPPGAAYIIRQYDSSIAPRTDAERAQNISQKVFDLVKRCDYFASVKVDGTSITMCAADDGSVRVFGHNYEVSTEDGIGATVIDVATRSGLLDIVTAHPDYTFQMELCGPAIQSNRLRLGKPTLFVFSVWDRNHYDYISPYEIDDLARLDLTAPKLPINLDDFAAPADLIDHVDGIRGNVTKNALDEGIVIHVTGPGKWSPADWPLIRNEIESELGSQMQMKAISNRYLLKAK